MKKLTTIVTAALLLFSVSAFASNGDEVTAKVKFAFEKDFTKAKNVYWKKTDDFYFASFIMNDFIVDAAYNEEAELVGTSRKIAIVQLPLSISLTLSQKYSDYTVSDDATELTCNGETKYFVTVVNEKQILRLHCISNGDVSVDKKIMTMFNF